MPEKSVIGLKNLVAWELTADSESIPTTYGSVVALSGAIEATVAPDTSEANIQYADDVEYDVLTPNTPYTIEIDIAGMTIAHQAWLQGHSVAADGGLVIQDGDTPPYIAFAFKSEKADGGFRYVVVYKAKPEYMSRAFKTKEGTTLTRQTSKMTLKGVSRLYDGLKQYIADALPSGFFTAPHAPVISGNITITTQPLDTALANAAGGGLTVEGSNTPAYQWYKATAKTIASGVVSTYTGNATASLTIPTSIAAGTHYFYAKASKAGYSDVYSEIAVVIVAA